jgi:hypothetical protein
VRLRITVAIALVVVAGGLLATGPAPAGTGPQLPDLEQVAPYQVSAYAERRQRRTHFQLAFGSASQNVGQGRLVIAGHRSSTASRLMTADQLIDTGDPANPQKVPGVGVLRYTRSPDHEHWHFLDFMRYELHRAWDFRRVGRDRKTGFCLGDRFSVGIFRLRSARAAGAMPGAPSGFDRNCGQERPNLLQVMEGITPRSGDDYHPALEGQAIEITGLRSGRYILVHRTNATHRIQESDYANNVSSALLYISMDRRRVRPPGVRVLKTCWHVERCR